ncbi:hypothetical protein GCM10023172_16290 [Hymenobacter ginsengisoli]|uniref:Uncharacterized protein n=1 Tax=Hymenobacter ginsengisoli TaxID=1051626 RepID=A0ABP8QBE8_9BACT|nr:MULTISPECIES: hypothetical protein [unclassified Hymenobacter]MBO2030828.1 hypothetical protein [Hymenobacter sp. BT559]
MSADTDNLDDLFRQQLGQHATPPSADLARRLAELAEAERLDARFRTGLGSHASQPRREVWERLEDEHLRPQPQRRRRVVAWWQLSAAAMLLLTLLAGGLWRGGYWQPQGGLASQPATTAAPSAGSSPAAAGTDAARSPQSASPHAAQKSTEQALAQTTDLVAEKNQKNFTTQATAPVASSSSPSIAATARPRRPATALRTVGSFQKKPRPLDAAADALASTERRPGPASQSVAPSLPEPADSQHPPVVAMTSAPEIIEVEVRRGTEPSRPALVPVVTVASTVASPARRPRLRLGGLLRQAGHLVHGEPVSLAEATELTETVTVQARLGGRTLSKTIQL